MKIAFVCNEYPPRPHGGIGTFVGMLAPALVLRGHDVTVVGMGAAADEHTTDGVRVVTLRWDRTPVIGNVISRWRLWHFLRGERRAGRIELLEVPDHMGWLPVPVPGCATVVRLHLSDTTIKARFGGERGRGGIAWYERNTLRRNPHWIAVSRCVLEMTEAQFGLTPREARVIYNPVTAPAATSRPPVLPDDFVLYASAVSTRKGALVLAEAMRPLLQTRPGLHLVYAGWVMTEDGAPVSERIAQILGPDLMPRVHFLGRIERAQALSCLERARLFAFPSRLEAMPIALLEAMQQGTPIVASSYPPGPEMITPGENGLLADPDEPPQFTAAIARVLDDPALAQRLAATARNVVRERHTLDGCVAQSVSFYRRVLGAAEAPEPLAVGVAPAVAE